MLALAAPDWIVMAAYAAAVLVIGWRANRRQKDAEDYFLGGRRLKWWAVGVSLVATSFSSVSLIGGTGFGFTVGMRWLQLQIGDLLALVLVCVIFLPFFSSLRLTTAYEYLERRFGVTTRTAASALFLGQTLLRASILIYSPALALSHLLGWSVEAAIVAAAAAAILYSALGGIGAVVWTDLIQMLVILLSVGFCLALVASDLPGGIGTVFAKGGGKLGVVTVSADPRTPFNLLGALVPYAVLAFSLFGTGQQAVQRFLSVKDLASARRAAIAGWTVGTVSLGLTLFLGVSIAVWASISFQGADFSVSKGDEVLPAFILARLPVGMAGLAMAAIFAASMSSLDSAIHSMSTAWIVDFRRRFGKRTPEPRAELRTARIATVVFGILAIGGALYASREPGQILELLVTWLGYFAGPLLGLFLLGILSRRTVEKGALAGAGLAVLVTIAAVILNAPAKLGFHPLWLAPASCLITLTAGRAVSAFFPAKNETGNRFSP